MAENTTPLVWLRVLTDNMDRQQAKRLIDAIKKLNMSKEKACAFYGYNPGAI